MASVAPGELAFEKIVSLAGLNAIAAMSSVINERVRQIEAEGFSPEFDDLKYNRYELGRAACAYAWAASSKDDSRIGVLKIMLWPWHTRWWKPGSAFDTAHQRRRRMLVKAGALILAQIEQLDRREAKRR